MEIDILGFSYLVHCARFQRTTRPLKLSFHTAEYFCSGNMITVICISKATQFLSNVCETVFRHKQESIYTINLSTWTNNTYQHIEAHISEWCLSTCTKVMAYRLFTYCEMKQTSDMFRQQWFTHAYGYQIVTVKSLLGINEYDSLNIVHGSVINSDMCYVFY